MESSALCLEQAVCNIFAPIMIITPSLDINLMIRPTLRLTVRLSHLRQHGVFGMFGNTGKEKMEVGKDDKYVKVKDFKKQQYDELNRKYKEYQHSRRFVIKEQAQVKQASQEEIDQYHDSGIKALQAYLDALRFENTFNEQAFLELLVSISDRSRNASLLESEVLQEVIIKRVERMSQFTDMKIFLSFLYFLSFQPVTVDQDTWLSFRNFILNTSTKLSFHDKMSVLNTVSEKNQDALKGLFPLFENEFLKDIRAQDKVDFIRIYQILEVYRHKRQGSDELFLTIEHLIEKLIKQIKIDEMMALLKHYSGNPHVTLVSRQNMLSLLENKSIQMSQFFSNQEVLKVLYYFQKSQLLSVKLQSVLKERVLILLASFGIEQLEQALVIFGAVGGKSRDEVFTKIEEVVQVSISKYSWKALSNIFFIISEQRHLQEEFVKQLMAVLTQDVHQMGNQEIVNILWSLVLQASIQKGTIFMNKAKEVLSQRLPTLTIQQLSTFIYSIPKFPAAESDAQLLSAIEESIVEQLPRMSTKETAYVLWGYTQNIPLKSSTIQAIATKVMADQEEDALDIWEINIVLWFFAKVQSYDSRSIFEKYLRVLTQNELVGEMSHEECLMVLKSFVETDRGSEQLYLELRDKLSMNTHLLDSAQVINACYCFNYVKLSQGGEGEHYEALLSLLMSRFAQLKAVVARPSETESPLEEYERMQSIERIRRGEY